MYAEVKQSKDDQWYFVIKGENHEVVVTSETYTTEGDAKRGAELFVPPEEVHVDG